MKVVLLVFILSLTQGVFAAEPEPVDKDITKVEYTYKKKEVFDFGELTIQGKVLTPGDLSIKMSSQKFFRREFNVRQNFDPEVMQDLHQIGN